MHHLFSPLLLLLLLFLLLLLSFTLLPYFTLFSIIKLLFSHHTSFTLILLPIPPGWEGKRRGELSKQLRGAKFPAQLKPTAVGLGNVGWLNGW